MLVDRGSDLAAEIIKEKLHRVKAQLCPILTEESWGIGINERSRRYLQKNIDRLLLRKIYDTGHDLEVFLADDEVGWDFALHTDNIFPNYNHFQPMSRFIGLLDERRRLTKRTGLMTLARKETETLCDRDFIAKALDKGGLGIVPVTSFAVRGKPRLHRHRYWWRIGTVAAIDRPTVMIEFEGNLYLTHHTRVRL